MSATNVDTICPLTPLQHGMLHAARQARGAGLYVEQFSCALVGALDTEAFRAAWQAVVDRHDVLKTLFLRLDTDKPVQVVRRSVTLPFLVEDWRDAGADLAPEDEAARFAALLAADRRTGFDESVAPLMRVHIARTGAERHRFLWTYHHAILDGWSMPVLLREVFDHLAAPARALPAPRTDYRHYLAWLARQDVERSLAFWRGRLAGFRAPVRFAPAMTPTDDDPAAPRRLATRHAALAPTWAEAAGARCRAARVTLNTLCQAAWALLLAHYGDADDVVHGVVVSGRGAEVPGIERMAGLFIGTLPVRTVVDPDAGTADWLRRLQADTQEIERHAATPLARVLSCAEVPRAQALFDTLYVFENYPGQSAFHALVASRGLRVEDVRAVEETGYGLALVALPADGLRLQLTYDVARFTPAAIDELLASYRRLLDRLLEAGDAALGTVFATLVDEPAAVPAAAVEAAGDPAPPAGALAAERALLACGQRSVDRAAFARAIAQGRAAWARLGAAPGERVLLAGGGDPIAELVALVSGASGGLEIVVPATGQDIDEALAAARDAFGAAAPLRAVVAPGPSDDASLGAHPGCKRFVVEDAEADGATSVSVAMPSLDLGNEAGTVTWLGRSSQREPVAVCHGWSDLVTLARRAAMPAHRAAAGAGATHDARVALAGSACAPAALAAVLRAWFGGTAVTLCAATPAVADLGAWLRALHAAPHDWDEVLLDAAQTRALAALEDHPGSADTAWPRVPAARWSVDAASLTPRGARALARLAPGAQLQRRLDDGLCGGVVAEVAADGRLHAPHEPGRLAVVGAGGAPVAPHALGRLGIRGRAAPAALWRRGRPDGAARVVTKEGPLLRSTLAAWRHGTEPRIALPAPCPGAHAVHAPLAALERTLGALDGVHEVAADLRRADDGEWELAIEFVAAPDADGAAATTQVRAAAAAATGPLGALGVLGVPRVEALARLPRGADGRIDRLALRRGEVERLRGAVALAPRDEIEAALHAIWRTLLKRERIGMDEDYFDLGGDSLLATVMLAQVQAATGVLVEIDALLRAPTIAGLARTLREGTAAGTDLAATLARDAARPLDIAAPIKAADPARTPREVFLTGATGFLGVHLLAELLAATGARVHCLVRAADAAAGRARLEQALRDHALWTPEHAHRIVAVPGDLGPPRFGLAPAAFDALAHQVDTIFHNGAAVNFVLPYAKLKAVNVDATDEVLRLAALHRAKPVHYVSTVGVLDRAAEVLDETLAVPLHPRLMGGYEQSKWVAEQRVRAAGARGLAVTIHRPSRIVGHSRTGRANVDDLFCRLIRGVVAQGRAPYGTGYDNLLPVDLVARLVVEASLDPDSAGRAIHVVNPHAHAFDALVDFIAARGHRIERLPYAAWLEAVDAAARADTAHPLAPLLPVLRLLDPAKDPTLARPLPLAHANLARLAPAAFADIGAPQPWLAAMLDHLQATGHLPTPPFEGARAAAASPERAEQAI
jgi:thioester reductase-like protein